jgi:2-(1,2-epoxy-1,2-dihydrophenyl)acetyl-CoA isomerase
MTETALRFELADHVARLTLDRPEANALDLDLARALMQAAMRCDHDPDVRAVLLTGAGRFFCAGGDLRAMSAYGALLPSGLKEMTVYLHAAVSHFVRMRAPLVIAVNGAAAGAGMSLAAAGDLVLAAESATFTMAYTAAGLVPDGASTWLLPRLIGLRRTQELMLTNRRLTAPEAHDWGLVTRVVADDRLADEAAALAATIARGPTAAFAGVKRLLCDSFTGGLETRMEAEGRGIAEVAATADGREGIAAFLERRRPTFGGA